MEDIADTPDRSNDPPRPPVAKLFRSMVLKAVKDTSDPWAKYEIEKIPAERVRRHRYLPTSGNWVIDESLVKIEKTPFDAGAMREVYRMKKISQVLKCICSSCLLPTLLLLVG